MPSGRTIPNIFVAVFLSLPLTILCTLLYIFYPLILAAVSELFTSRDNGVGGIAVVVGGTSEFLLFVLLLVEPLLFLLIFALLQRRIKS